MASLVGQQLKDTYDSLLKTSDNDALGGTYKEITDGSGNGSNLYLGTGGRVGIGTNLPSNTLSVFSSGASAITIIDVVGGSTGAGVLQLSAGTTLGSASFDVLQNSAGAFLNQRDNNPMSFYVNNDEKIRIEADGDIAFYDDANNQGLFWDASAGSLGIGTTSPNQLLEVANSSGGATINISTDQTAGSIASKKFNNLDFSGFNNSVLARIQSWDESSSTGHGYLTFHTFKSGGSLTEQMRIDYNGNVGIGTISPDYELQVGDGTATETINIKALNTNPSRIFFSDNDAIGQGRIHYEHGGDYMNFYTDNSERMRIDASGNVSITTGNLILDSGAGIDFSDTPNSSGTMTSELLDDYEEGTWTIGLAFGGASVGLTYTRQGGTYTKIGRQVTVCGDLILSAKGSSTGNATITGLPFTINGSSTNFLQAASFRFAEISFTGLVQGYGGVGSTVINMEQVATGAGAITLDHSDFEDATQLMVSLTYFV